MMSLPAPSATVNARHEVFAVRRQFLNGQTAYDDARPRVGAYAGGFLVRADVMHVSCGVMVSRPALRRQSVQLEPVTSAAR
jgi:hypothetical protein